MRPDDPDGDYYDPDEDVRPSSPGLVETQINYKIEETPPPYIPTSSSSSSVSPARDESKDGRQAHNASAHLPVKRLKKKRRKKGRTRPSLGDSVLISYLDPNQPDIARKAGQEALNSASQSEAGDEEVEEDMSGGGNDENKHGRTKEDHHHISAQATELKFTAEEALEDVMMDDPSPEKPVLLACLAMHEAVNGNMGEHTLRSKDTTQRVSCARFNDPEVANASLRSLQPLPLKIVAPLSEGDNEVVDDSITTSPALAKFAITAAEANPESTLPAMQKSSPRSASSHSPDGTHSLPSIKTALAQIPDPSPVETPNGVSPFSAPSPTVTRSQYIPGNAGLSPGVFSQPSPASSKDMTNMSPPNYPNHPSYWRNTTREGSSTVREGSFTTTSPVSVPGVTSVTSYPTSKDNASPEGGITPQILNGPSSANGPFTSTAFKCTYAGCTALPFQTQYLLNSHANVHSSSRPHYCPVKTCPRSMGGTGFKRKNEMNRHGLVHDSPGYVCPFCADQQHRYPRPDNLQRYELYSRPGPCAGELSD